MEKTKLMPALLVVMVFLGAFTLVSSALIVDADSAREQNRPRLSVRVAEPNIQRDTDHWFYVKNPSWSVERPATGAHAVVINSVDVRIRYPDGTLEVWEDVHQFVPQTPDRWDPIVKPGEKRLVLVIGWLLGDPGTYKFTYTFEAEYEGDTYLLRKTIYVLFDEDD